MTRNRKPRLGRIRRLTLVLSVATVFQLGACQDFAGFTFGSVLNSLPSSTYQTLFGISLIPAQLALSLATGGTGSSGDGSGGNGGLGGIGGVGGVTSPVGTGGLGGLGTGGI